jgi:hypothetical protein
VRDACHQVIFVDQASKSIAADYAAAGGVEDDGGGFLAAPTLGGICHPRGEVSFLSECDVASGVDDDVVVDGAPAVGHGAGGRRGGDSRGREDGCEFHDKKRLGQGMRAAGAAQGCYCPR